MAADVHVRVSARRDSQAENASSILVARSEKSLVVALKWRVVDRFKWLHPAERQRRTSPAACFRGQSGHACCLEGKPGRPADEPQGVRPIVGSVAARAGPDEVRTRLQSAAHLRSVWRCPLSSSLTSGLDIGLEQEHEECSKMCDETRCISLWYAVLSRD